MCDGPHPGSAMHIQADQAGGRGGGLTGVDSHPHPHPLPARPLSGLQGALHVYHRRHAGRWRGEHGKKRVPLGVHLLAVMGGQSGADQRVMVCQHPAVHRFPPRRRSSAVEPSMSVNRNVRVSTSTA